MNTEVLVIGSGAAGLAIALRLADESSITILSKNALESGSTYWAQGGMAAVLDKKDSVAAHVTDTLVAGDGLCHKNRVAHIVENSPETVQWLLEKGVSFSKEKSEPGLHLTREGGHTHRRIIHSKDATGKEISTSLGKLVNAHPNIRVLENHIAIDLIKSFDQSSGRTRCTGCYVLNRSKDKVKAISAKIVVLATGGASKVYLYSTNSDGASGDGIAMAWRAGCRLANMEFNQFHPTCLYHPKAKSFLISEAMRGEGAHLKLPSGERFMFNVDKRGELAPRDIVARAIDYEMKRLGCDHLLLDISHKSPDFIMQHFPTIYERCKSYGIDITKEAIPVVPAAHYTCGGVMVDQNGATDLDNLYAIGEVSFTGMHGANRMASNSLLECFVYAKTAAVKISETIDEISQPTEAKEWDESRVTSSDEDVVISHNWDELRRFMWDYVGIVRTDKRLKRALHRVNLLQQEINDFYSNYKISNDLIELRNLVVVAERIIVSAMQRKESRGLHYSLDHPNQSPYARDTILVPIHYARQELIQN